jgi:hypothetical protein
MSRNDDQRFAPRGARASDAIFWARYARQRAESDGRRQREAARERSRQAAEAPPEAPVIDWEDTRNWRTPSASGVVSCEIRECTDELLWKTIIWIVRNAVSLCQQATTIPGNQPPLLFAYRWIRSRPGFRALVRESVRRALAFPDDVFRYLKQYVLDEKDTLDGYVPWNDPLGILQTDELKELADMPLIMPEREFGRALRAIDLD